jgi:DNA polymerase III epsilon subunit-like protein
MLEAGTLRIFFDLETSGVGTPEDPRARIVAIAAAVEGAPAARLADAVSRALARGGAPPRGCFSSLVNPMGPQSKHAVAVHGLSDEVLARARDFGTVWTEFCTWAHREQALASRRGLTAVALVGHNSNSQDAPKLLSELRRAGRRVDELLAAPAALLFEDTYPQKVAARETLRRALSSPSLRLADLHASACPRGGAAARAHDALWDAAALRDAWACSEAVRQATWRRSLEEATARWAGRARRV